MDDRIAFAIRPLPNEKKYQSAEVAFRVHLNSSDLAALNIEPGDPCRLQSSDGAIGVGIAWVSGDPPTNKMNKKIAKIPETLKAVFDFRLNQTIYIQPGGRLRQVDTITVRDISKTPRYDIPNLPIHYALYKLDVVHPKLEFEVAPQETAKRSFQIEDVQPREKEALYRCTDKAVVLVNSGDGPVKAALTRRDVPQINLKGIEALAQQVHEINKCVENFISDATDHPQPTGILLYGPRGVGKSLLLDKLSDAYQHNVVEIDMESTKKSVTDAIKAAVQQHAIILVDEIELIPNSITIFLRSKIKHAKKEHILVVGATRSLGDVPGRLMDALFKSKVEIPVPGALGRAEVLKSVARKPLERTLLEDLAENLHGYVWQDLDDLVEKAFILAKPDLPSKQHFTAAKQLVPPSAMKEIKLEVPNTKWAEIAGSEKVKKRLERFTVLPFKQTEKMSKFRLKAEKGILLYGPPGCSKTLTAKATATESNLNFLSVKGTELISMYVGESERAIREVFRKARMASPCILFFDEIDTIAGVRDSSAHNSLHTLTTLLLEMDGIESLKGVLVLAATNRPEIIDPALLRPGRLGSWQYISPPNLNARRQIFQLNTTGVPLHDDVDLGILAEATDGYSGAEIVQICQEAGFLAIESDAESLNKSHFEEACTIVEKTITPEMCRKYEQWGSSVSGPPEKRRKLL
ncbi:MAG: hypothetical protein M1820_008757 [Bogoriella megaspora]|nr:MAG: hypothetical protein M1820_008757 [Bogoriella megaspora]